jgi:transposase
MRRSWAPVGHTPVIGGDGGHRTKVSVIGAVSVSPVTHRLGFYFATEVDGYYTAEKVVAFLRHLLKHLRGKVVVIWDNGPNHKGPVMREFLRWNKRLRLERLPAYAPDLNPVEAVWNWLKWGRLANFVPDDLSDLDDWVVEFLVTLKHKPELLRALWDRSDLPFPTRPPDQ